MRSPRWTSERGATSIEYALVAVLIAVVIVGSVTILGLAVLDLFADEQLQENLQ